MELVLQKLCSLEAKIDKLDEKFNMLLTQGDTKKKKNAMRRQLYREQKAQRNEGKIPLPPHHVFGSLGRRDKRLKLSKFVEMGVLFGKADDPLGFLRWMVYHWNSEIYLKKAVTYSGSAFCVWNGVCRHKIGVGDLMHYYRKRVRLVPFLRTDDEEADFRTRMWWNWGSNVLRPIIFEIREQPEYSTFSERFKMEIALLCGGTAEIKIGEHYWDFLAGRTEINKMMSKIGPVFIRILEACITGLRATEAPPVPFRPPVRSSAD